MGEGAYYTRLLKGRPVRGLGTGPSAADGDAVRAWELDQVVRRGDMEPVS